MFIFSFDKYLFGQDKSTWWLYFKNKKLYLADVDTQLNES